MPGISTSEMTSAGAWLRARSSARLPSFAVSTSWPTVSSSAARASRFARWSSAMRILATQLSALQLHRRLRHVARHADTSYQALMSEQYSITALLHSEVAWLTLLALALAVLLLRFRPAERPVYLNTLWLFLLGVFGQAGGLALEALDFPGVASALHTIFRIVGAIALIRLVGFALFRLLLPLMGRVLPRIVEDVVILVLYVIYGLAQLRGAGVDLSSIVTTSAILTAVIAFAMQDTLGNLLGGLSIQVDNTVQVGDWVRIDDLSGQVRDIRWRSTLIETRSWETIVIPNSAIMKGRVAILGRREGQPLQWRRGLRFMVDPGVPPARVIAMVSEEMSDLPIAHVAQSPAPNTVLHGFAHGNLEYELRYYLTDLLQDEVTDSR